MSSVVCTIFEGRYHFGVAALINSLYEHGFRGDFYIGFRGDLPFWASSATEDTKIEWLGAKLLHLHADLTIHFLPVVTNCHFTNYKPDFILQLWEKCKSNVDISGIFYFDPDITNKCDWSFYEKWINYGVALVHEIVWNDMPATHPKRHQWGAVAKSYGTTIKTKLTSNINAGFIGVSKHQISFLVLWKQLIEHAVEKYNFNKEEFFQSNSDSNIFKVGDQDLLNLSAMCTEEDLSEFGPDGMDFIGGGWLMSHATGSPKPWDVNYFKEWINGRNPSRQYKEYWKYANGIIKCYPESRIKMKIFSAKASSFLARFYKR